MRGTGLGFCVLIALFLGILRTNTKVLVEIVPLLFWNSHRAPKNLGFHRGSGEDSKNVDKKSVGDLNFWAGRPYCNTGTSIEEKPQSSNHVGYVLL